MLAVVKLGGSAITNKAKPYTVRRENIVKASKTISKLYSEGWEFVLIHGGGSFGHPTAAKYRLQEGGLEPEKLRGYAETRYWMTKLNTYVVKTLLAYGVPAVSIQTSAVAYNANGKMARFDYEIIREMLSRRLVPVLYGDAVLDTIRGFSILSGDTIASRVAIHLGAEVLVYVMGSGGVYSRPPESPDATLLREISRKSFLTVGEASGIDVTGGLREKLEEAFAAAEKGIKVNIGGISFLEEMILGVEAPYTRVLP